VIASTYTGYIVTCGVCADVVVDDDSEAVSVFADTAEAVTAATGDDWTIGRRDLHQAVCHGDGRYHQAAREYVAAGFTIADAYTAAGYSLARAAGLATAGLRQRTYVRLGCDVCRTPLIRYREIDDEDGALFGSVAEAVGVAEAAAYPGGEPWWTIRPDGHAVCPADDPEHVHARTCRAPARHRRSRTGGATLPAGTRVVTRGTRFGNRNRIGDDGIIDAAAAVDAFRADVAADPALITAIRALRGRCIACWCGPDGPCHGDVILQIANAPLSEHDAAILAGLETTADRFGMSAAVAEAHTCRFTDPWLTALAVDATELDVLLKQWRLIPMLTPTKEGQPA
jgi:hypothetical protein